LYVTQRHIKKREQDENMILIRLSMDEIQSAYWNATSVTLHPVVVYYWSDNDNIEHKNFIYVSDVNHHNSTAVLTILQKLMYELQQQFPDSNCLYFTIWKV